MESKKQQLEKIINGLESATGMHEAAVAMYVEPLAQLLMDNPAKAIDAIISTYNHALNQAYTDSEGNNARGFIQAFAGGPFEAIPHAVYNAVGAVYPYLDRENKNKALRKVISILDEINYLYVQEIHTPGIREPLLLSDISICRRIYWPGLDEGKKLLQKFPIFTDLQSELIDDSGMFRNEKVPNDFCFAYSLLRSDFCFFGEEYAKIADNNFLQRTLKGIIGMRFAGVTNEENITKSKKRLRELLPESLHEKMEILRLEADWVNPELFK